MNHKRIHQAKEVLTIAIVWMLLTFLYVYVKFNDIPDLYLAEIYDMKPGLSKADLYRISFFVSLPIGFVFAWLHTFVYPTIDRTRGLLFNIGIRLCIFFLIAVVVFYVLSFMDNVGGEHGVKFSSTMVSGPVLNILIYTLLIENLIGVFILLRRSLGINFFLNTVTNTYRNPKEEERVMMFLDLESSTPMAEKLGHLTFSRCLQDCFLELSHVAIAHGGEIYQFVGDEAVITWKVSGGFNYWKCVDLYFNYMRQLRAKENMFLQKYGGVPVFRCAIHTGVVSTALVGDYKKEIAYHGEVLHLCSRLRSVCKEHDAHVLISGAFWASAAHVTQYISQSVPLLELKGIKGPQVAYRIREGA